MASNDKALNILRRKINRITNGKAAIKRIKPKAKLFSEKTGGSLPSSNESSRTSLSSSNHSSKSNHSSRSSLNSSTSSNRSKVRLMPIDENNENSINGQDNTNDNDGDDEILLDGMNGGDEQLPDNILAMVNDAQDWTNERNSKNKPKQAPLNGSIRINAKVEVFCAIGTYMGVKKTNFVKEGIVFKYQTGKIIKRNIMKRGKKFEPEYSAYDGNEYYTVKYLDNDIEYDVKSTRMNVIETNSQKQTLLYLKEREMKLKKESEFIPNKVNEIPESVLDTTLYSRLVEEEEKRREEVRANRHELLLSMERPFEGLQERTNEQMERKKNREKEHEKKRKQEYLEQKAKERIKKQRHFEKSQKEIQESKLREEERRLKKLKRVELQKKLFEEANERRKKKLLDRDAMEERKINERFPFKPQIPTGNIDEVLKKPDSYEDLNTTKMKASVNEARRQLYRARAARSKAEELVKGELRSSSHTSLAKAVLERSHGSSSGDDTSNDDPTGVNLSLLTNYRKNLKKAKKIERECQKKVNQIEKKAKEMGIILGVSNEARELLNNQQVFAFMTDEYKEQEKMRKQKGLERKARRAINGQNLTKAQKLELERSDRMKEIVRKNKDSGKRWKIL